MPLANRSAGIPTPFGSTAKLGRGLKGDIDKRKLRRKPKPRPGPGTYNLSSTFAFTKLAPPKDPNEIHAVRGMTRALSSINLKPTKRKKYKQPAPIRREKKGFADSTLRFQWMEPLPIPGPGNYNEDQRNLTVDQEQKIKTSYSAKTLRYFGEAPRNSAFRARDGPGPGEYLDIDGKGDTGDKVFAKASRAKTAPVPFLTEQPRFSDKYRFDGVETPAPHDYNPEIAWEHKQTRVPSTNSHQSVFKQENVSGVTGADDAKSLKVGRSASLFKTRSTTHMFHLGPGSHEVDKHTLHHSTKISKAPGSGSQFASSSQRFGHGYYSTGCQLGKREKRMERLRHKETKDAIKRGDPMFKRMSKKNRNVSR